MLAIGNNLSRKCKFDILDIYTQLKHFSEAAESKILNDAIDRPDARIKRSALVNLFKEVSAKVKNISSKKFKSFQN